MSATRKPIITQLTPEQEAQLPRFVEKWIQIGLCTQPADREKAERAIKGLYGLAKLREPRVIWCPCPLSAALATAVFATMAAKRLVPLRGTREQRQDSLRSLPHHTVNEAVRSAVDSAVDSAVRSAVGSAGYNASYYLWGGSLWAAYAAWADYFNEVLGIAIDRHYLDTIESCGYYWTLDSVCFASERPSAIRRNAAGQLHCEDDLAIAYPSGWGLYRLNGVTVPEWLVKTPAAKLDAGRLLKEDNAEVRRELVRKVGIERVCAELGAKPIDRQGDYELLMLNLRDGRHRPYLKMRNPSLGVFHVEGVHPDCKTVQDAINWRAAQVLRGVRSTNWNPSQLT